MNFMLKYTDFQSRTVRFCSYKKCWRCNVWRKMTSKMMLKHQKSIVTSCKRVILHGSYSPWKRTFPTTSRVHGNSGQVCKKKKISIIGYWECQHRKLWILDITKIECTLNLLQGDHFFKIAFACDSQFVLKLWLLHPRTNLSQNRKK